MRTGLIILFLFITAGAWAQIDTTAPNPNAAIYVYPTMSRAIKTPKRPGYKFTVMENGKPANFVTQLIADGFAPDGVLNIAMNDGRSVAVREMSNAIAINATWFPGFVGDSITDVTPAWKRIRDFFAYHPKFNKLYIPFGKYRITDTALWRRGVYIFGDGRDSSLIVRDFISAGHGSLGVLTFESKDSNTLISGVKLEDIGFIGNAQFLGHDQWGHAVGLLGTDGAIIKDCKFYDFRGDGIYVGAGKDAALANKRSNRNVIIENCIFDGGPLFRNRNGISIIDVDGANIHDNIFTHIGNDTLSRSVGCIDDERNNNNANARRINIHNNVFKNSMSVNTSAITLFTTATDVQPDAATAFNITENTFDSCFWGLSISNYTISRPSDGQKIFCNVDKNHFQYNRIAIRAYARNVAITHNNFKGNATNFSNIQLGHLVGADDLYAQDVEVGWNNFDSCGQNGVIELDNVRWVNIHDNIATNRKSFLYFYIDAGGSNKRKFDHIKIIHNTVNAPAMNDITSGSLYFINAPTGFNLANYMVQSTCIMESNQLGNRVGLYAGAEVYFNHSLVTHTPTVGTWDAGNELYLTPASTGGTKIICTVGGTFPVSGDTAVNTFAATNGGNYLTYTRGTNVLNCKLREGQYINLTGSALLYKIIGTNGTTGLYVDQAYNGTTGSTTATWAAPTFRYQTNLSRYTSANANFTITPGNQSSFIEGNLTSARRYTLGWDATTLEGVEKVIRNNSVSDLWLIMGDDGIGDTVTLGGKTDSIPIYSGGELHIRSTGPNTWRVQNYYIPTWARTANTLSWAGTASVNGDFYQGETTTGAGTFLKTRVTSTSITSSVSNIIGWADNSSGIFASGDMIFQARNSHRFYTNGGGTPKASLFLHNTGRIGIGTIVPNSSAIFDFSNADSLGIRLPNLTRTTYSGIAGKAPGLMAFGTTLGKIMYTDNAGATMVVPDSATVENTYAKKTNTVTINAGSGVTISQTPSQNIGSNPSYTISVPGSTPPTFTAASSNITNATTTAADATGIGFSVAANQSYHFHVLIIASLDNTGGIALKWTLPSGAGLSCTFTGNSTSSTAPQQNYSQLGGQVTGFIRYTGTNGTIIADGYIQTGSTAGVLQLQFNPVTAGQTATIYGGTGTGLATAGHIEIMQPILQ